MNKVRSNFGKWGWGLVIYCFLTYFICGFGNNTTQVMASIWEETRGWNSTVVYSLPTIGGWISVLVVYIVSQFYAANKLKLRPLILISGALYSIALALWGVVSNFTVFTILLISMYTTYVLWMNFANNAICSNWFPHKKGLVIGWTTIGICVGSGFGTPLFGKMITAASATYGIVKGSEIVYFIIGGFSLLLTIIGGTLFTEFPEQRGCNPDNDKSMSTEQVKKEFEEGQKIMANSPWTAGRMLKTKETWLIALSTGVLVLFASGAMSQMFPRLLQGGYTENQAYTVMSFGAAFGCLGSYLCGVIDAKFGPKVALIVTLAASTFGAILNVFDPHWCQYVSMAIIGVGMGGAMNFLLSMATEYWGRYNFSKAYGTLLTINQLIGMAGAAVYALIANAYGYVVAYLVLAAIEFIGILLILPVKNGFVERAEAKWAAEKK